MANHTDLSRADKLTITKGLHQNLVDRAAKGPPEPGLDIYINELSDIAAALDTHVTGKTEADATRLAMLEHLQKASDDVATWVRRSEGYIGADARRRTGGMINAARALYDAAFPKGLAPLDEHITDQNVYCHAALTALRSDDHKPTLLAIGMPLSWLDALEASLKESDALNQNLIKARGDKSAHVGLGQDAEAAWADGMVRLRRHVESRAKRGDTAKRLEGKLLLEPLLVGLKKLQAEAASRATRKKKKSAQPPKQPKQTETKAAEASAESS